jgi:hypothetical protein
MTTTGALAERTAVGDVTFRDVVTCSLGTPIAAFALEIARQPH